MSSMGHDQATKNLKNEVAILWKRNLSEKIANNEEQKRLEGINAQLRLRILSGTSAFALQKNQNGPRESPFDAGAQFGLQHYLPDAGLP